MRIATKLTYANVVSTLCLFLLVVGVGGTAAYAHGKIGSDDLARNAVKSKHIKNGQVTPQDLKGSLRGQVKDATSPWDDIPRGRTVTGRYYDTAAAGDLLTINLPARAPVALTDSDIIVTGTSGNATCTGSYVDPTAPRGKVCVYNAAGTIGSGWTFAGSNEHDHHVFYLTPSGGYYYGSWAYTAP
ncbi:hypothetical protein ncot_02535 [Nocardioides sp. JQ2195]|uniref:hypothetical protein n=1 Tax=Nocardioides sp. JQ2195 TaxID=2592334 RepID=UPI00143E0FC7|nr:hypothetical protein [Nocardioides sp. JQ2195]QIX25591.1 hypothetical protein ncot_02535 [Nocardioides sp. JQ2195]